MSKRFFTSDWHLQMKSILKFENRPFKTIEEHDNALISSCCLKTTKDDIIIHIGDLFCYKSDIHNNQNIIEKSINIKPNYILNKIPANFINIRGNHDINNKVKSLCESMRIKLGKRFPSVSIGHYPSYDIHAKDSFINGDIRLCGHVHKKWKHCLDLDHSVLNINMGVDVWNYCIVGEDELISYIEKILNLPKDQIIKARLINGKIKLV